MPRSCHNRQRMMGKITALRRLLVRCWIPETRHPEGSDDITKAQKQQKETYDRKHFQKELEVNTKVLLEDTAQQQRKGGKMEPLRLGPYTINRCLSKGIYELKNMKGEVLKKKANIARLSVFKNRAELPASNLPSTASKAPETSR